MYCTESWVGPGNEASQLPHHVYIASFPGSPEMQICITLYACTTSMFAFRSMGHKLEITQTSQNTCQHIQDVGSS